MDVLIKSRSEHFLGMAVTVEPRCFSRRSQGPRQKHVNSMAMNIAVKRAKWWCLFEQALAFEHG
jgi:hypothetical protein